MVIHDREPADGHREDFRKFLEPIFDPVLAVVLPFPEQEGAPDTARDAVIPAGYGRIDQMGTSDRHGPDLLG